jgi:Lon-like ATP-dependent protease
VAITGEVSIRGNVRGVGGIVPKVTAARQAGVTRVIIPMENWQEMFRGMEGLEVSPVGHILEVFSYALLPGEVELTAELHRTDAPLFASGEPLRVRE